MKVHAGIERRLQVLKWLRNQVFADVRCVRVDIGHTVKMGQAAEIIPPAAKFMGALLLLTISVKPVFMWLKGKFGKGDGHRHDRDRRPPLRDGEAQGAAGEPPVCAGST